MEDIKQYDYLVIGGGSGGVASARRASTYGASVCLIESGRDNGGAGLGGTCVNFGCVPKKVMYNTAIHNEILHSAESYGFSKSKVNFNWSELKRKRDEYVKKLNRIYALNLEKSGVTIVHGKAKFCDEKIIEVNGSKYTAKHILLAVGGYAALPDIPGKEHMITSDGFFALETQPRNVAIIGAGYIAVELAGIFQALGTSTTMFCRGDGVLRRFDSMIQEVLNEEMTKSGITIVRQSNITKVEKNKSTYTLRVDVHGKEQEFSGFDCVLAAVGRHPLSEPLNLPLTGVKTNESGFIKVDEYEDTSVPGIHAIGDVTSSGFELTPVAIAAGRRLADRLFGGKQDAKLNYNQIPTVVFSHPPVGTVGYTESDAEKEFGKDNLKVYKSEFVNLFFSMGEIKQKTAMKLVCLKGSEKIVGLHVIGMGADEMLQGFAVAIRMGATKSDFDKCVAIHPTASEEFVTMFPWGLKEGKIYLPSQTLEKEMPQMCNRFPSQRNFLGCNWNLVAGGILGSALTLTILFLSSKRK